MNPIPPPSESKTPPKLDWEAAQRHLEKVESHLLSFAGQPGHNPYIAIVEKKIDKFKASLKRKLYSDELYKAIMALDPAYIPKIEDLNSAVILEVYIPDSPEIKTSVER